jgi:PPOX class probable F420-dependent enzyme
LKEGADMPKADRLSPGAVKLLREKQIANLATTMPDGSPQVTPVWVDVEPDGSHVLINTADGRVKTRNAERDPRVVVSVVDSNDFFRYAIVKGTIVERRHEGANEHIDAMAKKYIGQDKYPWHQPGQTRVILRIKPEQVMERGV